MDGWGAWNSGDRYPCLPFVKLDFAEVLAHDRDHFE